MKYHFIFRQIECCQGNFKKSDVRACDICSSNISGKVMFNMVQGLFLDDSSFFFFVDFLSGFCDFSFCFPLFLDLGSLFSANFLKNWNTMKISNLQRIFGNFLLIFQK